MPTFPFYPPPTPGSSAAPETPGSSLRTALRCPGEIRAGAGKDMTIVYHSPQRENSNLA